MQTVPFIVRAKQEYSRHFFCCTSFFLNIKTSRVLDLFWNMSNIADWGAALPGISSNFSHTSTHWELSRRLEPFHSMNCFPVEECFHPNGHFQLKTKPVLPGQGVLHIFRFCKPQQTNGIKGIGLRRISSSWRKMKGGEGQSTIHSREYS